MPSTTNLEGEEIVDTPEKDGNMSLPEQVKRPNPSRKVIMLKKKLGNYVYFRESGRFLCIV
jgi:hypothetical protein